MKRYLSSLSQDRLIGGALVLAVTQFGASLAGFVRDIVFTRVFEVQEGVIDVYIAAFRPSDLLFQVCIMAGFSVAFVPLLARFKASGDKHQMHNLLNGVTGVAALIFGSIALLIGLIFPMIAPAFVHFTGSDLELYIHFGRIALLTNFLFVFGNAYGQYLITIQRYWIYGITPILYTVGTIVGTLFLTPFYGVYGPIFGTLGGAILYVLLRLFAVYKQGYKPHLSLWHPDIKTMGFLMLPRMAALGALQLQLLLFDKVASGLATGSVLLNAYARNVQSAAVGLVGIALAQSAFSSLSQAAANKEIQRFFVYLKKGIHVLLLLTIPGLVLIIFLTPVIAWVFNLSNQLPVFGRCLLIYALSIPFESINHLLLRAFYAIRNTIIPACLSVLNGFTAIAIAWILAPEYGVMSLAIGFAVGQVIQLIGLAALLRRRVKSL